MAGRGRGRGRGRGQPMMPRLTDDEGNTVSTADIGPPPLFPKLELPTAPELGPTDERLVERGRALQQFYQNSPFYLGAAKPAQGGTGKSSGDRQDHTKALTQVMILDGRYFPRELYSDKERKVSSIAASAEAQEAYFKAEARKSDRDVSAMERLARLETQFENARPGSADTEAGDKKKNEDGEPDEEELIEEDEDDFQEEDDYYQGEAFDDDEEYGDTLDDGGDDGAIY